MFIPSINSDFDEECHHCSPQSHGFSEAVAVLLTNSKYITSFMLGVLDIRSLGFRHESLGLASAGIERF